VESHVKVENFHVFQSLHYYQRNSELWRNLFLALCHIVCILCTYYNSPRTGIPLNIL